MVVKYVCVLPGAILLVLVRLRPGRFLGHVRLCGHGCGGTESAGSGDCAPCDHLFLPCCFRFSRGSVVVWSRWARDVGHLLCAGWRCRQICAAAGGVPLGVSHWLGVALCIWCCGHSAWLRRSFAVDPIWAFVLSGGVGVVERCGAVAPTGLSYAPAPMILLSLGHKHDHVHCPWLMMISAC